MKSAGTFPGQGVQFPAIQNANGPDGGDIAQPQAGGGTKIVWNVTIFRLPDTADVIKSGCLKIHPQIIAKLQVSQKRLPPPHRIVVGVNPEHILVKAPDAGGTPP